MLTAVLWVVLASGHATEPLFIEGETCKSAVQSLIDSGYRLTKGATLHCIQAYGV